MRPRKVILCVDDNEQKLSIYKFLLETRGYRVVTANSPREARKLVDASAPGVIDLLLCDCDLMSRAPLGWPTIPTLVLQENARSPVQVLERIRLLLNHRSDHPANRISA